MKSKPYLTLADVKIVGAACEAEAVKNNWNVAIVILDDGGHPLWLQRLDGATPANAEIALQKARTAALSRRPSKSWEDRITGGRLAMLAMPLLPIQGGVPIAYRGEFVGAIGVSGVQSHEDEQIAMAGANALN